jgi:hypothetical protein
VTPKNLHEIGECVLIFVLILDETNSKIWPSN